MSYRRAVLAALRKPRTFTPMTAEQERAAYVRILFESIDPEDPGYGVLHVDAFLRLARMQNPNVEINFG